MKNNLPEIIETDKSLNDFGRACGGLLTFIAVSANIIW